MRTIRAIPMLISLLLIAGPASAKENRNGVGVTYTTGKLSIENVPGSGDFSGYTLFYKGGFNDRWGLLLSYRNMAVDSADVGPGEEFGYVQIGVHAVVLWRHAKEVRPFVKAGLVRTDVDISAPGYPAVSDNKSSFSIGGGLEAGSERIAFYLDYDFTRTEMFNLGNFDFSNLNLGIIFKF